MRYSSPAICTLILGVSPITIAFYGNWKQKECSYKSLMIPSILICIGLAVINIPSIIEASSPSTYILGLVYALLALGAWTWYLVANSAFLKKNPAIDSGDWSTLIGVGTLFWALILGVAAIIFFDDQLDFRKYVDAGPELTDFLIGCLILGFLCSWVGGYLWNKASLYLPVPLAGQLTILETFFGLSYVYLLEQRLPPFLEFLGILLFVVAIVYGIRVSSHERAELIEEISLNLETAVQDNKVMQDFELESLPMGAEHSQKVKAAPIGSDYGSKDCVNLLSSTAVSRLNI